MRKADKGIAYIQKHPEFEKWINECMRCHRKGYNPSMPEHIGGEYSWGAFFIKKYFTPLELDENGFCCYCKSYMGKNIETKKNCKKHL